MQLGKLSRELKDAYRESDVRSRVRHFDGWIDRATPDVDGGVEYEHTDTVKDYYDLLQRADGVGLGRIAALRPPHAQRDPG